MKKLISIILSISMILTMSVPAFAASQDTKIQVSLVDGPLFAADYVGVQVVGEIIEEVPNSNVSYVYHDLSNGDSISYMIQDNEVVYKAYVNAQEHVLTEYTYSDSKIMSTTTEVVRVAKPEVAATAAVTFIDAGQIKFRTPIQHLGTILTKYLNCSYRSEFDPTSAYNVAREAANKAAYASFLATLIGIPVGIASTLAGVIMGLFGLGAGVVGFIIPEHILYATKTTMYWKLEDSVTPLTDRFTFSASKYVITDEEQLDEVYQDIHYYEYTDFVAENEQMAAYCKQLIYPNYSLEAVEWILD